MPAELTSAGGSITIKSNTTLSLKAPSISIEADMSLQLKGSVEVSVQGGVVRLN